MAWEQEAAQHSHPIELPTHLGRGADAAEELGVIASDCSAVCQRLAELWGFREISLGKPLCLVNSSCFLDVGKVGSDGGCLTESTLVLSKDSKCIGVADNELGDSAAGAMITFQYCEP